VCDDVTIKKGDDETHSFILYLKVDNFEKLVAIPMQISAQQLLAHYKPQRAQHTPKCSTTKVLAFMSPCCKHEQQHCQYDIFLDTKKSASNNASAMDSANLLHTEA
jgi:hypothetical protein